MTTDSTTNSQWVFPISALSCTPTAQERSLHEEMYDRSRGIEFLYRLGTSIGLFVRRPTLPTPVSVDMLNQTLVFPPQSFPWPIHGCDVVPSLLYAVFYARLSSPSQSLSLSLSWPPHSSLIRHQTIAAACVFLATKTEECGRKLRDVARVCQSKAKGIDVRDIPESGPVRLPYLSRNMDLFHFCCFSQEIDEVSSQILAAEEVLLEALCFDFVIDSPHADLVDLFDAHDVAYRLQDYAWSIAHDSSVLVHPHAQAVFWL